jgi:hypothetical protein
MEEPLFADKSKAPSEASLSKALGRAKRHWDAVRTHALAAMPGVAEEWKCYAGLSGWTLILRNKRRNLAYLRPLAKHFGVSFAFGGAAVAAAEQSDLPAAVIEMIRTAPQYPEGRAVRVDVKTAADAQVVQKLLAIKADN